MCPSRGPIVDTVQDAWWAVAHIFHHLLFLFLNFIRDRDRGRFKELIHKIVEVGKFKICQAGWQAGDPGKS